MLIQPAAASWLPNRARNARLIGLSSSPNSPTAAGNATARCARSWLAAATRWATRSLRARTAARSATVAGVSGISGRSRARSVRSVSASTNESNRSSLSPADPYRDRRFLTCREVITTTVRPARQQRLDQRTVAALDRDLAGPGPAQPRDQSCDPGPVMDGVNRSITRPAMIHHARDMISVGPVDPGAHPAGRDIGQNLD